MSNDKKTTQGKDYKRGYSIGLAKGVVCGFMTVVGVFVTTVIVHKVLENK